MPTKADLLKLRIFNNARFSRESGHKWYCEEDIFEEIDKVLEQEQKEEEA